MNVSVNFEVSAMSLTAPLGFFTPDSSPCFIEAEAMDFIRGILFKPDYKSYRRWPGLGRLPLFTAML